MQGSLKNVQKGLTRKLIISPWKETGLENRTNAQMKLLEKEHQAVLRTNSLSTVH